MSHAIDIVGRSFGRLRVVSRAGSNSRGRSTWNCQCECGTSGVFMGNHLLTGNTSSCGCGQKDAAALTRMLAATHGRRGSYYYGSWSRMISRCYNASDKSFKYYGGRGIRVCEFIRQHPDNFIAVVGPRPQVEYLRQYSIDRIDNNAHYSCGRCAECLSLGWIANLRWATAKQQAANRRPRSKRNKANA